MKHAAILGIALLALMLIGCGEDEAEFRTSYNMSDAPPGVFIHISHGPEDVHRVLMGLQMAVMMSETQDVLVYFDIHGIEAVLKDSEDLTFAQFPSSHTQIKKLIEQGVDVMACPGCLEALNYTPEDLMEGVKVANKNRFFEFTDGRILTLDY